MSAKGSARDALSAERGTGWYLHALGYINPVKVANQQLVALATQLKLSGDPVAIAATG